MTEQEIKLIKTSWAHFRRVKAEVVADAFYSKLFLDNPSLRKLFPTDMEMQYEKFVMMLNTLVARLDNLDILKSEITAMGVRHKAYKVKPSHYKVVGEALIWTLKNGLSNDWNEETEKAWLKIYTILSDTMIAATKEQ
jgi:hemoglobin-like flavoprotein